MSVRQRSSLGGGNVHPIIFMFFWMTTVSCTPSFQCPEMAVLNSSVDLTCCVESSFNAHSYTTPDGDPAASCNLKERLCISNSNSFNASVVNQTCSVLTIHRTLQSHEGCWKCGADADAPHQEICHVSVSGTQHVFCPEVSQLGMSVSLTCIGTKSQNVHSYLTPSGKTAATCDLAQRRCITQSAFKASVINTTSTAITINNVSQSHDGDWVCAVGGSEQRRSTCRMTVAEGPTCYITSDRNASLLSEGDTLTLTVNLSRSDCPGSLLLQLRTGNISSTINTDTDIEDGTLTKVFNVTSSHVGEVSLIYTCSGSSWDLPCEGIKRLVLGKQVNITTTPTAVVVVVVVVGVGVIVGIVFIIRCLRKRRENNEHRNQENEDDTEESALKQKEDTV